MGSRTLSSMPSLSRSPGAPHGERWIGIVSVIVLHGIAIGALLHYRPFRDTLASMAPIMVSLVTTPPKLEAPPQPAPPAAPKIKPLPKPRSQPTVEKPIEPSLVTAPTEAPSTFIAPAPPPPEPVAIEGPKIEAAAPAPPPPTQPPSFNADYLQNPSPPYPSQAKRMREQGRVVLRVLVSAQGLPEKVELRTSSGSPRLDRSALETVARWKFVPARQGDQPVAGWVLVPISFSLEG